MINIKNLDTTKIKIIQNSCKNIIYYTGYVTVNNENPIYLIIIQLYLIINKVGTVKKAMKINI